MIRSKNPLASFFGVILKGQTYLNLLYLLLVLPLGLLYFTFLVLGVTIGIAFTLLLVGLIILGAVALGWWAIASFERYLAIWLLRVNVPPMEKPGPRREGTFGKVLDWFVNPVTWKSLVFILIKFPLGIFTFVVVVALGATSIGLLITPLTYRLVPYRVMITSGGPGWVVDSPLEAVLLSLLGLILGFISLHVFNYLALAQGLWAQLMLGNPVRLPGYREPELPLQPVTPAAPVAVREVPPPPFYEPEPAVELDDTPPHGLPVVSLGEFDAEEREAIPLGPPAHEPEAPPAVQQGEIPAEPPSEFLAAEEGQEADMPGEEATRHVPPGAPGNEPGSQEPPEEELRR